MNSPPQHVDWIRFNKPAKNCIDVLLPTITKIVNLSLSNGHFPDSLKCAHITPLFKKGKVCKNDLKSYRPIANLKFLAKTIERVCSKQIQNYLRNNKLLGEKQSAYRAHHSTETALLRVYSDCFSLLTRQEAILVLLDYSAAFDTINHDIFFQLLQNRYGVPSNALCWFKSYFTNRSQAVVVNDCIPNVHKPVGGVPQGSVMGPLSFTMYTSPVEDIIKAHGMSGMLHADDTQVYAIKSLNLIRNYTPRCCLRSSSKSLLVTPPVCTKSYGSRSFQFSSSVLWNDLSIKVKEAQSVLNLTDEEVWLRPRTPLGKLQGVSWVEDATVVFEGCEAKVNHISTDSSKTPEMFNVPNLLWPGLSDDQLRQAKCLLMKNQDVFASTDYDLGFEEVQEHVRKLLAKGVIKPSTSPYASPVVLVRKTDGTLRLCIDYRKLNGKTRKDAYPLPRIQESLDALTNAKWFSTIDLISGYHQVEWQKRMLKRLHS
ncbi:putative RNA-directed DNA polymerase from mobile element jockey-like [Apostichopus japonicus]|uniref:Putative RNA-directed DNA polymerase from mobile element jockey-like n=1 Tax=Stichopus japonicus TaxID=307972 RepID=A0A2G8JPJ4_STIJA|nr:putative RNA-directed DNA polymerase from mobile element jockey-like [Apostichopus japonicus]